MDFIPILSSLVLATQPMAPVPETPPPGLLFGFYRIHAFASRADELGCGGPDRNALDREFAALRKKLIARYGEKPFSPPKPPRAGPGDCSAVLMVYRVNLGEYRKAAEAELAKPAAPEGQE